MSSTESTSNRPDEFKTHWLGYISAAIFLYIEGHNINNQGLMIISIFVGIASIFILLGQLPVKMLKKLFRLLIILIDFMIKSIISII